MFHRIPCAILAVLFWSAWVAAQPTGKASGQPPKPGAVIEIEIAKNVKMSFCWIPAGEAQLGSPPAEREEALKHVKADAERMRLATEVEALRGKYKTKGFWMARFAVPQG